jgi:hypothetical protein
VFRVFIVKALQFTEDLGTSEHNEFNSERPFSDFHTVFLSGTVSCRKPQILRLTIGSYFYFLVVCLSVSYKNLKF